MTAKLTAPAPARIVVGYTRDGLRRLHPTVTATVVEWITDESYTPRSYRVAVTGDRDAVDGVLSAAILDGVYVDRSELDGPSSYAPNTGAGYSASRSAR